jgi:hypothetical protein
MLTSHSLPAIALLLQLSELQHINTHVLEVQVVRAVLIVLLQFQPKCAATAAEQGLAGPWAFPCQAVLPR